MRKPLSSATNDPLASSAGALPGALTVQAVAAATARRARTNGSRRMVAPSSPSGDRVPLLQDLQVMTRVPGHDPRQGPDRDRLPARGPHARPLGFPEPA